MVALGSCSLPRPALATDEANRATARELAVQAQDALNQKDYVRANDLFARAQALVSVPTLALGRVRAEVGLGKLVSAHERYVTIVREGAPAGSADAILRAVEDARPSSPRSSLAPRLSS